MTPNKPQSSGSTETGANHNLVRHSQIYVCFKSCALKKFEILERSELVKTQDRKQIWRIKKSDNIKYNTLSFGHEQGESVVYRMIIIL